MGACFRVEGFCEMAGVPVRFDERFYLRTCGVVVDHRPRGCHLHADPAADDDDRLVRAEFEDRGDYQALQAVRVGPLRSWVE